SILIKTRNKRVESTSKGNELSETLFDQVLLELIKEQIEIKKNNFRFSSKSS
ncbi:hypothetical protein Leryth_026023, partial [Lithospermum erythrorhizon]